MGDLQNFDINFPIFFTSNGKAYQEKISILKQITIARLLRERIEHLTSSMGAEKNPVAAAIDRAIREQAFTILNRFAALRLCEERGLVEECVRQGLQSKGFKPRLCGRFAHRIAKMVLGSPLTEFNPDKSSRIVSWEE